MIFVIMLVVLVKLMLMTMVTELCYVLSACIAAAIILLMTTTLMTVFILRVRVKEMKHNFLLLLVHLL